MEQEDGSHVGLLVLVVVVVILLAAALWWYYGDTSPQPVFKFTDTGTTTFVGNNYAVYTSTTTASGLVLTVSAPVDPEGKQFIIDNSGGTGIVTIASPISVANINVSGTSPPPTTILPSNKVRPKTVALFIWKNSTTLLRLT